MFDATTTLTLTAGTVATSTKPLAFNAGPPRTSTPSRCLRANQYFRFSNVFTLTVKAVERGKLPRSHPALLPSFDSLLPNLSWCFVHVAKNYPDPRQPSSCGRLNAYENAANMWNLVHSWSTPGNAVTAQGQHKA